MSFPDYLHDVEHRIHIVFRDILAHFLHPIEQNLMASIALLTQTVTDLGTNVAALTTAVQTLVATQGTNQAQFEAQLDPVEQALEQLNGAIAQLTTAVTITPAP